MHFSSLLLVAATGSLVRASDARDRSGDVWAAVPAVSAREPSVLGKRQSTWNPPASLVTPLQQVWDHEVATYQNGGIFGFMNYGYDIITANNGNLNFCVRWESKSTVTAAQRTAIEASLNKNVKKWTDHLTGFMGWPYATVNSKVVGWATTNKALLEGSTAGIDVYTTVDAGGIAECDPRCGRYYHLDNNYSQCPGGASHHYDVSLWLTDGFEGGAGGDWGQRVGKEYFLSALDNPHIWLHEFGHTMGLDDFYDWTPTGVTNFVMLAGSSEVITDFDFWMMRDFWRHLVDRYTKIIAAAASSAPKATTSAAPTTLKTSIKSTSTTLKTSVKPTSTSTTKAAAAATAKTTIKTTAKATPTSSAGAPLYGQCGGSGWTGPTTCVQGKCTFQGEWYSQCIN